MKKLDSRLKKIFISLLLALVCFVGLCGIGLKTHAASYSDNGVSINVDNDTCIVFFSCPYGTSDLSLIKDDINNDVLVLNYSGYSFNNNGRYYVQYNANGNSSYPMFSNRLYAFAFDNGIDRYTFYEVDFDLTRAEANNYFYISASDINVNELFVVSGLTGYVSTIDILSNNFIARIDYDYSSTGYVSIIQSLAVSLANTNSLFDYAKSEYLYGYNQGYSSGYNTGYTEGQSGENAISPVWNLFQGIFSTIGAIFTIELAPHIYIGYFFLVPLFFGVVGLILWIWRRN